MKKTVLLRDSRFIRIQFGSDQWRIDLWEKRHQLVMNGGVREVLPHVLVVIHQGLAFGKGLMTLICFLHTSAPTEDSEILLIWCMPQ